VIPDGEGKEDPAGGFVDEFGKKARERMCDKLSYTLC
jgi:hypothetical protein